MSEVSLEMRRHETVMDVTAERIARVYAVAFYGAAAKSGDAASLVDELQSLVHDVLDRFPQLEVTLRSALVAGEDKESLIDRIFSGRASTLVLNSLKVLSRHGRLGILRSIARQVRQVQREKMGQREVEVRVAQPLDDALRREILDVLRSRLAAEPILQVVVDPDLLAGFVIRVGDTVYDGSVRTRLERTRRAVIERVIENIETQPERFMGG